MKKQNLGRTAVLAMAISALIFTHAANAANIGFVRNPNNSLAGDPLDNEWVARLGTQGHTVTVVSQSTPAGDSSLLAYDLFIVSQDVGGAAFLGGVGINQPKPMLFYEPAVYNSIFGASAGGDLVSVITILDSSHPLAAGLSGNVTIYNGSGNIPNFNPAAVSAGTEVIAVADVLGVTRGAFAVLEPNQIGNGGATWPAIRIGLPCYDNWDPALVTADGWTLLDNAVAYALVPEPSSLALIGFGMVALLARRQRR